MRHRKQKGKLSRDSAHRKALFMNLCREVIDHERIQTTEAKAKAVKPELERLITLAKRGDPHARRTAMARLGQDKFVVYKLFEEIAPRYAERRGGIRGSSSWGRGGRTRPRWSFSSSSERFRAVGLRSGVGHRSARFACSFGNRQPSPPPPGTLRARRFLSRPLAPLADGLACGVHHQPGSAELDDVLAEDLAGWLVVEVERVAAVGDLAAAVAALGGAE